MNIENIENYQINNPDLKIRRINNRIHIIYFETLCDSSLINDFILKPINQYNIKSIKDIRLKLPSGNIMNVSNEKELFDFLFNGFTIICINNKFIGFETKYSLDSGINEASNEKVIKGPKDAFTENYQINIGLIRKRIKSRDLMINEHTIGTSSKTKVSLIYMNNIADINLVSKIEKKIKKMNTDYIANSNYIIENITNSNSIFPLAQMSERPDLADFSLMEGKIVIVIENTPQVLIIPTFFNDYLKTIDDYYQNTKNVTVTRVIRLIAFLISILTPALYIALTTFNQETLPTSVLINFSIQREGVPFPSIIEAIVMWLIFEILRESDTRIPFVVGSSMSIVGALVVGQAAVEAGMISPIMIIVIAVSSISAFLFNDNDFVNAIRIWKLIFLLLSAFVGLYGFFIASMLFVTRLCSLESFGYDYTYPLAPFNKEYQKNNIFLSKKYKLNKRNPILTKNINRR